MNSTVIYILIVSILLILFILNLERLRRNTLSQLHEILYVKNQPEQYEQLLKNPHFHLLFSKGTLEHLKLEGWMMQDAEEKVKESTDTLKQMHLARGEWMDLYPELLSYWCRKGNQQEAAEALDGLRTYYQNVKDEKNIAVKEDAERIYRIYIQKDTSLIPELRKLAEQQEGNQKAVTLFRIAKLQYPDNTEQAIDTLKKADQTADHGIIQQMIEDCLKDPTQLNRY